MIKLLIGDDHPIVREGLKRIIAECPDMSVVGEAAAGDEVLELAKGTPADVLLLDISMPGPGFLETLRRVQAERPGLKVLVLSVQSEENYAVRSIRAGAAGYLSKERSPEELERAIRHVHMGRTYVTLSMAERLACELGAGSGRPPHSALSDREYQILCLIGAGKGVSTIAEDIGLSPKTVSTYRARILRKMHLQGNADIIRYVVENGLI